MSIPGDSSGPPALSSTDLICLREISKYENTIGREQDLRDEARRMLEMPVRGVRGGTLTVAEAKSEGDQLRKMIDYEIATGDLRNQKVSRLTQWAVWIFVVVVDFPIMLWACSSIFNVDWEENPWGILLLFSFAAAVVATVGSAAALHHLGHEQRDHKTETRSLAWKEMPLRSKGVLIGIVLLVILVALVVFARFYQEGVSSGLSGLAFLLAALVALVMLISASLIFTTAFRNGTTDTDDLDFYTRLVQRYLTRKKKLEGQAETHKRKAALIRLRAERAGCRLPQTGFDMP